MPKANLRAVDNAGTLVGCVFIGGLILAKVAFVVLIIWVLWHFISKYW